MKTRLITLLMIPLMLAGCSSTYVYNNLDWLLHWYLDDYVELNKAQKPDFDEKLDTWLFWHREQELVQYQKQLSELKNRFNAGPLGAEEWQAEFTKGREHWERLRDRVVPELVAFAPRLTDKQVNDLFEELEKQNLEREERRSEKSEQERREDRIDNAKDDLKGYIGRLTNEQEALIQTFEDKFKTNFDNWIAYRRAIHGYAKTLMESRNTDPGFKRKLTELMENPESFQSEEYIRISQHNRATTAQMIAELNLTLTAKQKKRINIRVDDLLEDLDDLIND